MFVKGYIFRSLHFGVANKNKKEGGYINAADFYKNGETTCIFEKN